MVRELARWAATTGVRKGQRIHLQKRHAMWGKSEGIMTSFAKISRGYRPDGTQLLRVPPCGKTRKCVLFTYHIGTRGSSSGR